jgi:hypothetical protein
LKQTDLLEAELRPSEAGTQQTPMLMTASNGPR